ncbi:hypothetical protein LIT25_12120 [Bacillus sp. F19]|nr:hypothetical protein LIT25_12120 [Bacillus sp. F19]
MKIENQIQYREDLLEWCNNIYFHWESLKPRFSKLFDLKSLEEWEESYRELKGKLQTDLKVDFDDYQAAKTYMNSGNCYTKNNRVIKKKKMNLM